MKCISLYIFIFCFHLTNSCKNFLVQHCIDVPLQINPISNIKCIQLLPIHINASFDYTVKNYIIKKASKCYDVFSLNSNLTVLFAEQCQDICSQDYCQLFDNQPNTSIINIFYPTISNYELITSFDNNIASYDYYLFDSCSSSSKANRTTLIIVYILVGVVVSLAISVLVYCLVQRNTRKKLGRDPWNIHCILDYLCCQLKEMNERAGGDSPYLNGYMPETPTFAPSSTAVILTQHGTSSSANTIQTNETQSSLDSGSDLSQVRSRSALPSITSPEQNNSEYIYRRLSGINEAPSEHSNQRGPLSLTERLSAKLSNPLSSRRSSIQYTTLTPESSLIIMRF